MNKLFVRKSSGEFEPFSEDKLRNSLLFTGASEQNVDEIMDEVGSKVFDGISTKSIYKIAFTQLRKISRPLSAYYGTKRALLELGPQGYHFEKFIARILKRMNYDTKVSVWIEGKCIEHEVDVIAEKDQKRLLIECKFHNAHGMKNDIKTALYVKARSQDISNGKHGRPNDDFWLVSNTSFSDVAIRYATCAGLHIWGSNFPPQNTLQDYIRDEKLDSITCLSGLNKKEKTMLMDSDIYLALELQEKPQLLDDIGLTEHKKRRVLREIKKIQGRK
jgi:hypothetical protein